MGSMFFSLVFAYGLGEVESVITVLGKFGYKVTATFCVTDETLLEISYTGDIGEELDVLSELKTMRNIALNRACENVRAYAYGEEGFFRLSAGGVLTQHKY